MFHVAKFFEKDSIFKEINTLSWQLYKTDDVWYLLKKLSVLAAMIRQPANHIIWFWRFVQGVQDQNFRIQTAITQKLCTWDPKLVKPKCVWEIYISSDKVSFLKKLQKNTKFQ